MVIFVLFLEKKRNYNTSEWFVYNQPKIIKLFYNLTKQKSKSNMILKMFLRFF